MRLLYVLLLKDLTYMSKKLKWLVMFILLSVAPLSAADDDANREALRHELEHLADTGMLSTGEVSVAGKDLLITL